MGDNLVNVENLIGSSHADPLIGDTADNRLEGGDGNDLLAGGSGIDSLFGGQSNDTCIVTSLKTAIVLKTGAGSDTIVTGFATTLAANVENLTLTWPDDLDAAGSEGANVLTGNAGRNALSAGREPIR